MNNLLLNPERFFTASDLLTQIDTISFPKGQKHEYSNSNYFLLGFIIEKITEKPLEFVIVDMILKPYHLQNTYPYFSKTINNIAHPMQNGNDLFGILSSKTINDLSRGDGNIAASAADLYSFFKLLFIE